MDVASELVRIFCLQSEEQLQMGEEKYGVGGYLSFRREATVTTGSQTIRVYVKTSDRTRQELAHLQETSNEMCRNECIFYGVMAPIVDCALARCQLAPVHPFVYSQRFSDTGSILVMEDLRAAGYRLAHGNQMSVAEAECAATKMAQLQAAYWAARTSFDGAMDDAIFGWESPFKRLISDSCELRGLSIMTLLTESREYFINNIGSHVKRPEDEKLILDSVERLWPRFLAAGGGKSVGDSSHPQGVKHGDFWYPNVMFKDDGESLTCRIVDWQIWNVDLFGIDIGTLAIVNLPHEHAISEFHRLATLHYATFKEAYERGTGQPAPFSEQAAMRNVYPSLVYAFFWIIITSLTIWDNDGLCVPDILASLVHLLRTVQEPSG